MKDKNSDINLISIIKVKSKFKIFIKINKVKTFFYVNSIFENDLKNILASITIISIFMNINSLNKNIFYTYLHLVLSIYIFCKLYYKNLKN